MLRARYTHEASVMSEQRAGPPELFCVAGWTSHAIHEHEELLFQQHEAGAIQLYDRGRVSTEGPPLRRWRMSWLCRSRVDGTDALVRAALATREHADGVQLWFAASCAHGWGWSVPHPLGRPSLHRYPIIDPASGLAATGAEAATTPADVVRIARGRHIDIPVLVLHSTGTGLPKGASAFRNATFGSVAMIVMDEATARRTAPQLGSESQIPEHGARLFLPAWWRDTLDTPGMPADSDEGDWRELTRIALHAASWRASEASMPVDVDTWQALLTDAFNDQRVALTRGETTQWPSKPSGVDKAALRRRIKNGGDSLAELREAKARHDRTSAELDESLRRDSAELESLTESRRRLAKGVLRLREERNAAQTRIADTTVGEAQRRTAAATRLVRSRAERLRARRDEQARARRQAIRLGLPEDPPDEPALTWEQVLSEAADLPRIRLGEQVCAPHDVGSTAAVHRGRHVLRLLSGYRAGPVAEHLRQGGISGLLLGVVEAEPAVTFPVPPARAEVSTNDPAGTEVTETEWACFTDYVRLDHGTVPPLVLHYYACPEGPVHIGYIGPSLSRAIT